MAMANAEGRRSRLWRIVAVAATGLALGGGAAFVTAGCTAPVPAVPPAPCDVQVVTLNLYAADNINPSENGNPRPVVVRLYQLQNSVRLENATYDQILQNDKETLADDILKADDIEVFPNDLVQVKFERMKPASTLAGVAFFRSPKGMSWKTFYAFPLPPGEVKCGGRGGDAGKPEADPKVSFFIEDGKIDNGSQFDESMFPNATSIRQVNLPKGSAAPEAAAAAPAPASK